MKLSTRVKKILDNYESDTPEMTERRQTYEYVQELTARIRDRGRR